MKKNKLFILGLVTVFVALVSLTLVSSTWAKYTTNVKGSDSARVAYWGFNKDTADAMISINDLFDASYDAVANQTTDGKNLIAPGTSKSDTFSFKYTPGTPSAKPEVAYTLTIDVSESSCDAAIQNNANIRFALALQGEDLEYNLTWTQLLNAILALSGEADGSCDYAAGQLPTALDNEVYVVGWRWAFSANEAGDVADTTMGNAADLDEIKLAISITATQKDA